jgi:hypothetical protein
MNTLTITNIALFTAGASGVTAAIELAKSGQFIAAGICGVVGLCAIFLYEKLPASPTV